MSKDKIIWQGFDYKGRPIILATEVWEGHIIVAHKEMADLLDVVKETIFAPDMVVKSDIHSDTRIYSQYNFASDTYINQWMHVPVRYYPGGGEGEIISAYPGPSTKSGKIIYLNPDLWKKIGGND